MDDQKPSWFDPDLEEGIDTVTRDAIAWFNLLRSERATDRDRMAFRAWLRRDPAHPKTFEQVEQFWGGLSGLPEASRRRRSVSRRNFAKGALAVAAAGGAWGAYRLHPFADYRTGTGERRSVVLADDSRVELAASSGLSVDFDGHDRRVRLHYGEAFFDVARKSSQAFVAETSRGSVTALGTAFAIAEDDDRFVVTVTQHAVRIDAGAKSLRVDAGLQAVLDSRGIGIPIAVDAAEALAWREGRLIFVNVPLGKVVGALNRWRPGRLVVLNRSLAAQPVTLIVNLEDVESALHQLQDALPIAFTNVTPLLTFLHAS